MTKENKKPYKIKCEDCIHCCKQYGSPYCKREQRYLDKINLGICEHFIDKIERLF